VNKAAELSRTTQYTISDEFLERLSDPSLYWCEIVPGGWPLFASPDPETPTGTTLATHRVREAHEAKSSAEGFVFGNTDKILHFSFLFSFSIFNSPLHQGTNQFRKL
jgi:hypothetical protein